MIWPVKNRGKWGGINTDGQLVIPHRFDRLGHLSQGFISFEERGCVGFLDSIGSLAIEPMFDKTLNRMPEFRCQRASVSLDGRSGYAGPNGLWAFPARWTRCWDYVHDKAIVESERGYFVIDGSGRGLSTIDAYEVPFVDDWPPDWQCFQCHFRDGDRLLVGFINWQGTTVFEARYPWMTGFSRGVAGFCEGEDDTVCPFGLVDVVGRVVMTPQFYSLSDFQDGLARAGRSPREFGFIDHTGGWVIEPKYRQALPFSEGLACVTVKGRKGFINARGDVVIEPRFDRQASFQHGLASVEFEGKRAYIDKLGAVVWETRMEDEG